MHTSPHLTRRTFLGSAAVAALAQPTLGRLDALRVGCIGTGGRCRHLLQALRQVPNIHIVALADVDAAQLDQTRPLAEKGAFTTSHYPDLLQRKDVDAVLIASPDHWHVPMTIDACAAGKDVYVEKPLTHSRAEERAILDAQAKYQRIVQVGMQQRSMPHLQKARELVVAGRLGKVSKVHLTWNRNVDRVKRGPLGVDRSKVDWKGFLGSAPDQPFDEYRLRNWRWFWDFGGGIFTDLMVHWIDVAHWLLDLKQPLTATSIGSFVVARDIWQTPDSVQTLLVYPGDVQVYFEGTFSNARNGAMLECMGTEATLYVDRGRFELHPERERGPVEEMVLGTGKRGRDFYDKPDGERLHLENWVECIKTRRVPNAPIQAGVQAAASAHLANEALRSGQVARWK